MKIVDIFAPRLYAIRKSEDVPDEHENIFDLWNDIEYLVEFFEKNINDLRYGYYKNNSVEDAVFKTLEQAEALEDELQNLSTNDISKINESLDSLFKSLDNNLNYGSFEATKVYGFPKPSWLRIYAIKLTNGRYIITGGAIKLTKYMDEREHTKRELNNLRMTNDYLKENGISDIEGFTELMLDL